MGKGDSILDGCTLLNVKLKSDIPARGLTTYEKIFLQAELFVDSASDALSGEHDPHLGPELGQ